MENFSLVVNNFVILTVVLGLVFIGLRKRVKPLMDILLKMYFTDKLKTDKWYSFAVKWFIQLMERDIKKESEFVKKIKKEYGEKYEKIDINAKEFKNFLNIRRKESFGKSYFDEFVILFKNFFLVNGIIFIGLGLLKLGTNIYNFDNIKDIQNLKINNVFSVNNDKLKDSKDAVIFFNKGKNFFAIKSKDILTKDMNFDDFIKKNITEKRKIIIEKKPKIYLLTEKEKEEYNGEKYIDNSLYEIYNSVYKKDLFQMYYNITVGGDTAKAIMAIINVLVYILIFGFIYHMMSRVGNMSKPDELNKEVDKSQMETVKYGGNSHLKTLFNEIITLYKSKIPMKNLKGILMYGPPGNGKTLFAQYIAKELNLPVYAMAAGDFKNEYFGGTEKNIRNFFKHVREEMKKQKKESALIFLDELDSIGGHRNYTHEATQGGLNVLLKEMDGFLKDNIMVVGATNRIEYLDPALLSRFNQQIMVSNPSYTERVDILKKHLELMYENKTNNGHLMLPIENKSKSKEDTNKDNKGFRHGKLNEYLEIISKEQIENKEFLTDMAYIMEGFSGRDIAKVVDGCFNKCIIKREKFSFKIFWEAVEEKVIGKEKVIDITDEELYRIAYHEMGHALIGKIYNKKILKIAIGAKSMSLGQTFSIPEKQKMLESEEEKMYEIYQLVAGKMAEKVFIKNISAGAYNDYQRVYSILEQYFMANLTYTTKEGKELQLGYVKNKDALTEKDKDNLNKFYKIVTKEAEELVEKRLIENTEVMVYYSEILFKNKIIDGNNFIITDEKRKEITEKLKDKKWIDNL